MSITEAGQGPLFPSHSKNSKCKTQIYIIYKGDIIWSILQSSRYQVLVFYSWLISQVSLKSIYAIHKQVLK